MFGDGGGKSYHVISCMETEMFAQRETCKQDGCENIKGIEFVQTCKARSLINNLQEMTLLYDLRQRCPMALNSVNERRI